MTTLLAFLAPATNFFIACAWGGPVLILCLIEVKECLFSLPLDYMHVAVATSSVQIRNSTSFLKRFKIFVFATYVMQATADLSKHCLRIHVVFVQSSKAHQSYDSVYSSANVTMVGILRFLTYLFSWLLRHCYVTQSSSRFGESWQHWCDRRPLERRRQHQ